MTFAPVKRRDLSCSTACANARNVRLKREARRARRAEATRAETTRGAAAREPARVIPCDACGAPFTARDSRARYCSPACNAEGSRRRRLRRPSEMACAECGVTFRPVGQAVTCSASCSEARSRRYQCEYGARLRARTAAKRAAAPVGEAAASGGRRRAAPRASASLAPAGSAIPRARPAPPAPRRRRPESLPASVKPLWADLARLRLTARRPDEFAALHLRACYAAETLAGPEREAALWLMDEARAEARRR